MLGPQDIRHLHREIKASTPGLILPILLINTDMGVSGRGVGEQSFLAHSFSRSPLPVYLSLFLVLCVFLPPPSLSVCPPPPLFYHSVSLYLLYPVLCEFGSDSWSSPPCLFIYSISVTVKKKIATLGAVCALLCLMESQIEEVVLKASWPLCGDTNNVSFSLGSPRQLKMALQVHETWCLLDGTALRGAVKTVLAWGGKWSQASAMLPPAVSFT